MKPYKRPLGARIVSWNVNGLRSIQRFGFLDYLNSSKATVFGVQETRAAREQLPDDVAAPKRMHTAFASAEKKGYAGVALYARRRPTTVHSALGEERFDREGRFVAMEFGRVVVASVYFPNGSGLTRDNSRVPYKLEFYHKVFDFLRPYTLDRRPVFVMGDFNTAHETIDIARPEANQKTSGFLVEERQELTRWLTNGYVDTFRAFEKSGEHYSWWSQRFGVRARNIGWRIDYVLASDAAMPFVRHAFIADDVVGSDHCPVGVDVDPVVFEASDT